MNSNTEHQYNAGQNFGLNPSEFEAMLNDLINGNESLFEIIFNTHFKKCRTFLVRKLGADSDIAYDITLETLIKFRKNLLLRKIKYGNMTALFTIDARNTYLRWKERENKYTHISVETNELNLTDDDDQDLDMELITDLKRALGNVGRDCYELLNWHYYLGMPLRTVAEKRLQRGDEQFVNESSVKTKIAGCRKMLRSLLH